MSDTNNNAAAPGAIDKALDAQLAGICQAISIIHLTSESLLEPEDDDAIALAHDALEGARALLDGVLAQLETVTKLIRGKAS